MNAGAHVTGKNRRLQCDVIRELVKSPRTVQELTELCELSRNPTRDLLLLLHEAGLVHITTRFTEGGHRPKNVYHWCPVPFEKPETAKEAA
jgi:predicted transcriptional regulator